MGSDTTSAQCQIKGCGGPATCFLIRGEVYVGLPRRPEERGLCAYHLDQVMQRGARGLNLRAS